MFYVLYSYLIYFQEWGGEKDLFFFSFCCSKKEALLKSGFLCPRLSAVEENINVDSLCYFNLSVL